MSSFAESYAAGETPIPCVTCNQQIKFRDLLETAKDLGADALATGHYIERREGASGPELARARRSRARPELFPVRHHARAAQLPALSARRRCARPRCAHSRTSFDLPVADKSDSQDICFVPTGRYTSVIERLKPGALKPGDIVHVDGRVLGRHDGIINYTVGQRRGLKIPGPEPLYVVRLDAERNEVVVGPRAALRTTALLLKNTNWLGDEPFAEATAGGLPLFVRVRSSQAPRPATLFAEADGGARVVLKDGEDGVAVGQACVFYSDGETRARVLGGGFIARTLAHAGSRYAGG